MMGWRKLLPWVGALLVAGAVFGWWESCQDFRRAEAVSDSLRASSQRHERAADSLRAARDSLNTLADSLAPLTEALRDSTERTRARNAELVDALRQASEEAGAQADSAGRAFASAMDSARAHAPPELLSYLDRVEEAHVGQVGFLQEQVHAEAERADSNRQVIEAQQAELAKLRPRVENLEDIRTSLTEENAELRSSLEDARADAEHWKSEARPGFIVEIGRNLEKYLGAFVLGAGTAMAATN